jgi:hypothetical protein
MLLLLLACGPEKVGPPSPGFDARTLWHGLASTYNTCGEQFDYHPDGGLLIFACHVSSVFTLEDLQAASPVPIWNAGPHGEGLDRTRTDVFGHYNPEFVRWAGDALIPGARDPGFRAATQGIYDERVRPLARVMWLTRQKLEANPGCTMRELDLYLEHMQGGPSGSEWGAHYERWYDFHDEAFCGPDKEGALFSDGGVPGNVAKTVVGFWLRRIMDGTDELWAANLHRLLATYDADWLG